MRGRNESGPGGCSRRASTRNSSLTPRPQPMPFTIRFPFRSARQSVHAARVADLFGISTDVGSHVIAENLEIPVTPGSIIAFTGPSGSGKSSLLQALAHDREALGERVVRADGLSIPEASVIDALPLPFEEALALLSRCGLAEPRLILRRPAELSDGERWRFRLALAIAQQPAWIVVDEFTAPLDRTLAKIVAFNVRRQCNRTGIGFLIATCHTDVLEDLAPDVHVKCSSGSNAIATVATPSALPSGLSFSNELSVTSGTLADWPAFARWHYRSHRVGSVRLVTVLKHADEPVGICVFTTPPLSLAGRNRFFGRSGKWTRLTVNAINQQLATLSRVVLHPTYRGAGLAAEFVRRSCEMCPYPWIEALAQMGHVNPFFEKAGFVRVDVASRPRRTSRSTLYGVPTKRGAAQALLEGAKASTVNVANPIYYVFDNRGSRSDGLEA